MARRRGIRVALNGYVFFGVFGSELPELREILALRKASLVLTDKMVNEYQRIAKGMSVRTMEVISLVKEAEESCQIVRRAGDEPGNLSVGRHHRPIVAQACAARATHLVTEYGPWLNVGKRLLQEHGLEVLKPQDFVRRVRR